MATSDVAPLLAILLFLAVLIDTSHSHTTQFESWIKKHGRVYPSAAEKLSRFQIFQDNLQFITEHNSNPKSTYTLDLNAFADLTPDEFRISRLGLSNGKTILGSGGNITDWRSQGDPPVSVDWRKDGAVTDVKDQGSCGDCWAFSTTGAIEGINKIVTGNLVSLSEQELCDCDNKRNSGCNGGLMDYAFQWVIENKGIDTEDDYPYEGKGKTCVNNKIGNLAVSIDGYTDVPRNNEEALVQAVAVQPVSVGLCGSERGFQLYSKGIFNGPCSTNVDHAVLIVGYGSWGMDDYWIVKNSWGKSWGMDGYMYMSRNTNDSKGMCGVNTLASYPTKTSPNPSPPPSPTQCSIFSSCPAGATCCCKWKFIGICLSWGCCDMESAVCCEDLEYCCPQDYPICDISTKQCSKSAGVSGTNSTKMYIDALPKATSLYNNLGGWFNLLI